MDALGGADRVDGGAGNDTIDAETFTESLMGGTTRMNGGTGDDLLIGRMGEVDEFVFTHGGGADFGQDTISNFEFGTDRILIDTFQDDPVQMFYQGSGGTDVLIAFAGNAGQILIEGALGVFTPDMIEFI
jgi:Ca2+-binding RTX toxin-like protein